MFPISVISIVRACGILKFYLSFFDQFVPWHKCSILDKSLYQVFVFLFTLFFKELSIKLFMFLSENDTEQPGSPSLKKTEEKGIIVVHEVKCKLYVKVFP